MKTISLDRHRARVVIDKIACLLILIVLVALFTALPTFAATGTGAPIETVKVINPHVGKFSDLTMGPDGKILMKPSVKKTGTLTLNGVKAKPTATATTGNPSQCDTNTEQTGQNETQCEDGQPDAAGGTETETETGTGTSPSAAIASSLNKIGDILLVQGLNKKMLGIFLGNNRVLTSDGKIMTLQK